MGAGKKKREKASLRTLIAACAAMVVLLFTLLGTLYFYLVDRPVRWGIQEAEAELASQERRLEVLKTQVNNIASVTAEVESLRASGNLSWMPSYNYVDQEIALLNNLLSPYANSYSIATANPSRSGNQIRRGISLSFSAKNYEAAKTALYKLIHSEVRCLITNASMSGIGEGRRNPDAPVSVSLSLTFYETMAGGTPDAELPSNQQGEASDPMNAGLSDTAASGLGKVAEAYRRGMDYEGLESILNG